MVPIPQRFIVTFDNDGNARGVQLRSVVRDEHDFGRGPEPIEKPSAQSIGGDEISGTTRTAILAAVDAAEADIKAVLDRRAADAQRRADEASAAAAG